MEDSPFMNDILVGNRYVLDLGLDDLVVLSLIEEFSSILRKIMLGVPLILIFHLLMASGIFFLLFGRSLTLAICYRGVSILSTIPKFFKMNICDRITPMTRKN
jgi:hypothetical protein